MYFKVNFGVLFSTCPIKFRQLNLKHTTTIYTTYHLQLSSGSTRSKLHLLVLIFVASLFFETDDLPFPCSYSASIPGINVLKLKYKKIRIWVKKLLCLLTVPSVIFLIFI